MIDAYNEFPHEILFQREGLVPDGGGGWVTGWADYGSSVALVTPISSREYLQASQTTNPIEYEIYFPYRTDIKPDMRVLWDGEERPLYIKTRPMDQGGAHEVMLIEVTGAELNDG